MNLMDDATAQPMTEGEEPFEIALVVRGKGIGFSGARHCSNLLMADLESVFSQHDVEITTCQIVLCEPPDA